MLKCTECGQENSPTSLFCPKCGSTSQFRGYVFNRKEVKEQGFLKASDLYNFQKRGGKLKTTWGNKISIICLIVFGGYLFVRFME